MTNQQPPNKIALVLDGVVIDVLHTDSRLAAILLSEPTLLDVTDHYLNKDQSFNLVNWAFDGENLNPPN